MIPMVMRLKATEREEGSMKGVNLWIPLFLVWILLLPFIILAALAWCVLRLVGLTSEGARNAARLMEAGVDVLSKIDGLEVDVRNDDSRFILHF